ncbi:MAG: hypothetical protein ABWY20_07035 [Mycobacterium sp.]
MLRYELLRDHALAGDPGGWRCGLGVLQHRGLVAWLHAWQSVTPRPAGPPASEPTGPLPAAGVAERLVESLASMALGVLAGR